MAATRLIPMHIQKGKTMKACLKDRTDYAKNKDKTGEGEFVSSYECSPQTVDLDFEVTKNRYEMNTGRKSQIKDVIAYQIRQSFKPGEVTPEEANQIGYETAMRWTKGKHAFIVATHIDKAHVHNHIIYNSTTLDCEHKFKNFFYSSIAMRRLSDIICLEHGLSVIEAKKPSEWQKRTEYPKRESQRDKIRDAINACMKKKPQNMDEFLSFLMEMEYEIKRGKNISVKGKEQQKFIRLNSLGTGYREEDLSKIFDGETVFRPRESKVTNKKVEGITNETPGKKVDMLLDVQEIIAKGKGPGYERWARIHNVKQMAQTLLFLEQHDVRDYEKLSEKAENASKRFADLSKRPKEISGRMKEISELREHIINYSKTKKVYVEYREHGYSRKFFEEHRADIALHKAAKEYFSKMGKPIPKLKELNEEYNQLLKEKKSVYSEYCEAREDMKAYQNAKYNVDYFLEKTNTPSMERGRKHEDRNL